MKQYRLNTRKTFWPVVFTVCLLATAHLLCPARTVALAADEMSNEDAAKLLNAHEMFAVKQTVTLNIGTIHASLSDVERNQPIYATFKSMGLIEMTGVKIESPDKDPAKTIDGTHVSLTEKGLSESRYWKQVRKNSWRIVIADRQLVEILKIHKDEQTILGIEFTWKWTPNKTGEALKFSYPIEKAYARLAPEGPKWRIVRIRALAILQ